MVYSWSLNLLENFDSLKNYAYFAFIFSILSFMFASKDTMYDFLITVGQEIFEGLNFRTLQNLALQGKIRRY